MADTDAQMAWPVWIPGVWLPGFITKIKGRKDFCFHLRKVITRYRRIGYNLNIMRQSACLVFNPIMVDNYAFFNCTPVGRAPEYMLALTAMYFSWFGPEFLVCCLAHWGSAGVFFLLLRISSTLLGA